MHQHIRLVGSLALGIFCGYAYGDVNHALSLSVVQVHAFPEAGKIALGSGVVIGPGRVATNCHITRRAKTVIISKGDVRYEAVSQRADVNRDLCIVEAPAMEEPSAQIPVAKLGQASQLSVGEPLYLYGFPRAIGIAFSQGQVQSLHPYQSSLIIETSANFSEGASGGGIFNDNGELIGLATFFSAGYERHYYAIPSDWIGDLVKVAPRRIEPISGIPFWQDVERLPAFLRAPGS
jgi:S1-C subfamily serine protease